MGPLANVLERFNRKERNLLIREILGYRDRIPPLDIEFREALAKTIGILPKYLDGAWWATDFHFDWLAGALLTFMKGESQMPQDNGSYLIKGTQEDVDLVVVTHDPTATTLHHLILIEAKAYGHFSTEQYESKIARLKVLFEFYEELGKESPHKITFHYVLFSPTSPPKLIPMSWKSEVGTEPKHLHMTFTLPRTSRASILTVTRCNTEGGSDTDGKFWKCFEPSSQGVEL
jgi:hypothetical protein